MPRRRLITALFISLMLHLFATGAWEAWTRLRRDRQPLVASTITVTFAGRESATPDDAEALLKDTLAKEEVSRKESATMTSRRGKRIGGGEEAARRKLSGHVFYPPEAVARGLEGEVRLLLSLDGAGNIADVQIAASSGYAVLDRAAIDAARSMGRLDTGKVRELILPVNFRLK